MSEMIFTWSSLERYFVAALEGNYEFVTCSEYFEMKKEKKMPSKTIVARIDVDFSLKKAEKLCVILNQCGIKASFFIRLHAPEYNPFSFESYKILKYIRNSGHELGYHSEVVDQAAIWDENSEDCLIRDIDIMNRMLDIQIKGIASHGGMTGLNNLDFWKDKQASDFGLLYEAYDKEEFDLFDNSFYISDSEWTQWKCYDHGVLLQDNRKTFGEHLEDNHKLIYLLIHADTFYENHFYE